MLDALKLFQLGWLVLDFGLGNGCKGMKENMLGRVERNLK